MRVVAYGASCHTRRRQGDEVWPDAITRGVRQIVGCPPSTRVRIEAVSTAADITNAIELNSSEASAVNNQGVAAAFGCAVSLPARVRSWGQGRRRWRWGVSRAQCCARGHRHSESPRGTRGHRDSYFGETRCLRGSNVKDDGLAGRAPGVDPACR